MKLLRLEISGFKSFAKKTVIEFRDGITAIVGPNGSGKSNIADAIRWVLGEQRPKALRGAKMEDVIFNGTEQRKPLAFCEVTLVFDNSDGMLPTDFVEVSVTRRAYRTGEGEYMLNGKQCRLKDVQEIFRDTGIGKEGYSIIGQGKVDEILSNKSSERRMIFEEAAGVMRYRTRKEEAERRLENTEKNLERVRDVLAELEERLEPLERQSTTAKKYLSLREELKKAELNLFLIQYDKLNERISASAAVMEQASNETLDKQNYISNIERECMSAEASERDGNTNINDLQNKLLELTASLEGQAGESKVIKERIANSQAEQARLGDEIKRGEVLLSENAENLNEFENEIKSKGDKYAELQKAIEELTVESAALASAAEKAEAMLDAQKQSIIDAMNSLSDAKSRLARFETMKATLNERVEAIDKETLLHDSELEKLQTEFSEADELYEELLDGEKEVKQQKCEAERKREQISAQIALLRENTKKSEHELERKRSRIKVLRELKESHEGFYASVRRLLSDAKADPRLADAIEGAVAELIKVPREYETAIEMALGSALQNIIVPTENDAKLVINHLRSRNYGRATLLPVSAIRPRALTDAEKRFIKMRGCHGIAAELVECAPRYADICSNLLGRTVIVDDLDTGIAISRQVGSSFRIATLKGDIINPGGSMTGGSVQRSEFSLLGREREIDELENGCAADEEKLRAQECSVNEASDALRAAESELAELDSELHEKQVEKASRYEKLDIIKKYIEQSETTRQKLLQERARVVDSIADIENEVAKCEAVTGNIESGNVATKEDIAKTQGELNAKRAEQNELNERITSMKLDAVALERERAAASAQKKRTESEAVAVRERVSKAEAEISRLRALEGELSDMLLTSDAFVNEERKKADDLSDEIKRLSDEQTLIQTHIGELRERRSAAQAELDALLERKHRAEMSMNKSQLELSAMQERIFNDYEMTYENVLPYRRNVSATAEHMKSDELKKEIKALGDINVNAIEEYALVNERYATLKTQSDDLVKAKVDLEKLIEELLDTMKSEFTKQFALIRENFTLVFSELFRGGRAELALSDESDVLNCDIDIIAQPPGKRLQLMSLLSGGERALTAIALLFAILRLKPTAFCVLDEIETSLDETNVSNFAEYLKNYSKSTQFILITHRKGSMAVCNALYGVAMEEKGVSKIASAKFEEEAV